MATLNALRSTRTTRATLALRHSSRGVHFDRYNVIRAFFKKQPLGSTLGFHCIAQRNKHTRLQKDPPTNSSQPPPPKDTYENYPKSLRSLALSLPNIHRPTRDDFLQVANGFWQRARIRFKWFTIKSFRKFNADDISAFVTWFLTAQVLWIFIGTTTFFSVVFATLNSLRLQEYVARALSDYLTSETGVTIIFESAIVPKWKDSRISFKNVFISRRPGGNARGAKSHSAHKAALAYDVAGHPASGYDDHDEADLDLVGVGREEEDTNYSMFDLNVDSIDVTLSLSRWFDGKGLVEDAVVKGVRGVLDRRNVYWDPSHLSSPADYRHPSPPGSFELRSLQLSDVLITVYQSSSFRPYTFSIFRAEINGGLRRRWLFYDLLGAEGCVGQFDGCLFSLHRPQSIGRTEESDLRDRKWGRMSRIRIDGVSVDHLQASTSTSGGGPISWITSGKLDAVLDIKFPRDPKGGEEGDLAGDVIGVLGDIADAFNNAQAGGESKRKLEDRIPGQRELARAPLTAPSQSESDAVGQGSTQTRGEEDGEEEELKVVVDIDLRFRDLKAVVPIFTSDLSYVNNALIRPIVYFMNANRTLVPIRCRVVKGMNDFDGSWTIWETGLLDEISLKTYNALAYHVTQSALNKRRAKTVGVWSLQMTVRGVLSAMRGVIDPMRMRDVYEWGAGSALGYVGMGYYGM